MRVEEPDDKPGDWTMELDCGHEIEVPAVAGALTTLACVLEHRQACHGSGSSVSPGIGMEFPLAPLQGVALR
jgi:hypothetical protein